MKTITFIELLKANSRKKLGFEYRKGAFLREDYHITEVKNIRIQATDCGGRQDAWEETVIQLWEAPQPEDSAPQMRALKALKILDRVAQQQPFKGDTILKFEYGNREFHTSQLLVGGYRQEGDELIVILTPEHTTCKARDLCGVPETQEVIESECAPGSGCC